MNFDKLASKVYKKISQFGSPCVITRKGLDKVYDSKTNKYTSTDIVFNGYALQNDLTYLNFSDGRGREVVRSNVALEINSSISFMCVLDSKPEINDSIAFGEASYTISSVKPINPSGTKILYYEIQAS